MLNLLNEAEALLRLDNRKATLGKFKALRSCIQNEVVTPRCRSAAPAATYYSLIASTAMSMRTSSLT